MDEPDEYVQFLVKYKDWISIKKLGIYPDTKPEEVAFSLATIKYSIDNKIYALIGLKTDVLDKVIESSAKVKKSVSALNDIANRFASSEAKAALEEACNGNKSLKPIAEAYLLNGLLNNVGYETSISAITLSKIFPYLKLPKEITMAMKRKKKNKENKSE